MNKSIVMGAMVVAGLLLGACNDDDDEGGTPVTQAELEGKWYLRKSTTKGKIIVDAPIDAFDTTISLDEDTAYTGTEYYAQFNADSTYEFRQPELDIEGELTGEAGGEDSATVETGEYRLSGSSLVTISDEGDSLNWNATIAGGVLTLKTALDTSITMPIEDAGDLTMEIDANIMGTFQK